MDKYGNRTTASQPIPESIDWIALSLSLWWDAIFLPVAHPSIVVQCESHSIDGLVH